MESDSPLNRPTVHFLLSASYLFVFLATVLGNIVILLVFISQKRIRSVPNFFLANLTVADLFVGIFCVLQNAAHFVLQGHGRWPFGKVLCYSYIYTLHMVPNVSAGILVLVSVERLIAVLRPLRVRRTFSTRVLITSSVFVWTTSAIMNLPYYFASQYLEYADVNETLSFEICTRRHIEVGGVNVLKAVATLNFIVWYALPLLVLLFIYATIGIVVSRTTYITKNSATKLLPRSSWRSESSSGGMTTNKRRKVGRLAVGIVVAFAFFSLPRYLYFMWTVWRDPMNPFLYAFLSTRFRQSIKETFGCGKNSKTLRRQNTVEMSSQMKRKTTLVAADTAFDEIVANEI
ncbi:unnamed protein product [Caenorhabditis auriculariae]|uniref:G-protein coupled receptors family 1 profile domain-containing protein n=1 Tax=Caenorhabditis auriculariae TaxID=2777116 RepID=A0A8S1H1E6_9PELO|nr:unnamed protein product [Caenorhabditis auriculariae]